jgi:hypothetical protein
MRSMLLASCKWSAPCQAQASRLQRRPGGSRRKVACTTVVVLHMATREDGGRMFEVCSWSDADDSLAQGMWIEQSTGNALCLHSS